jgi:hypothetical protein
MAESPLESIVYSVPHEKFFYKMDDRWSLTTPVGQQGILRHLVSRGMSPTMAKAILKEEEFRVVHAVDIVPARYGETVPDIVSTPGNFLVLNVWARPRLEPAAGEFPRIDKVLRWLTKDDEKAVEWLKNWIAAKVQDPALVPKTAVVFSGTPGSGKGTFARVVREMLGPENCANITRRALENKFNARWANKLFVLADEVVTKEHYVDIAEDLKGYITSDFIEIEGKGENQKAQRNRIAWVFASNDPISPILVERGDRRYSVFTNHTPLSDEYRTMLKDAYLPDDEPTPEFAAEIAAFYHYCLSRTVDPVAVSTPYDNDSRKDLISASASGHEMFLREVDENGIEPHLTTEVERVLGYDNPRANWLFGADGVSKTAVYQAYVHYCRLNGAKPSKINRFGIAVKNHVNPDGERWDEAKITAPNGHRVSCYVIPPLKEK